MKSFWKSLPAPILALAPMENVTDTVFRQIVSSCGKPTVFFTEFTSVDGLNSAGRSNVDHRLKFSEIERPIVAQIWGTNPEHFYKAAQYIKKLGFDGIDINMGCPDRTIVKKGGCSGLIRTPSLARDIIQATRKGAGALPVSVKTRIGFSVIDNNWVKFLLEQNLDAITLHLRTVKEESKVPAHWDQIRTAVAIKKELALGTVLLGNGDVKSYSEVEEKVKEYSIDGVMVGRGIFENIWLFNKSKNPEDITPKEKLELLIKHVTLFDTTWRETKKFAIIRKFVKAYVNGFPHATDMRVRLMETETPEELISEVKRLIKSNWSV